MRRSDREISIFQTRQILEKAEYGVLSMASPDGEPYGVPMNFSFEKDCIYFHCAPEGKKIDLLCANERVSFCVVGRTELMPEKFGTKYESVICTGIVEEIFDEEKREGLVMLVRKYAPDHFQKGLDYIDKLIDTARVFKINLETLTGKARR